MEKAELEKLYHGTSARHLASILAEGIRPREELDADGELLQHRKGNWTEYPSIPDMVYLTTCYPLYFAHTSTEKPDENLVIFEVNLADLDEEELHPDEDIISQSVWHGEQKENPEITLQEAHEIVLETGIDSWQHLWRNAMEAMGNVGYRGTIEPALIRRYCIIHMPQMRDRASLIMSMLDPSISPINFAIKGWFYQQFVQWVFGDVEDLPHLTDAQRSLGDIEGQGGIKEFAKMHQHYKKSEEFWFEESKNREGFEVVTMKEKHEQNDST